jgi:hypothetical protein
MPGSSDEPDEVVSMGLDCTISSTRTLPYLSEMDFDGVFLHLGPGHGEEEQWEPIMDN